MPPGQCVLLMHGSPALSPVSHVFTHVAPEPKLVTHVAGPDGQGTAPHVTVEGHGHGPLKG